MKKLTEKKTVTAQSAWGHDVTVDHQSFEVEASDVGVTRDHFLGFRHKSYTFKSADVGKTIVVQSDVNWTCWAFAIPAGLLGRGS